MADAGGGLTNGISPGSRSRRPGGKRPPLQRLEYVPAEVQHGKAARMCHERGLAQGDVAPVSVTCWEHTIPSRGPTDQGLQGYRVSSLLCPRYVAVTGVAKRLIQTVSGRPAEHAPLPAGRPEVYISALHARPRRAARARAPATWLPRPAFKSGWFLRYCCCMAPHNAPNCSALLLLTTIAQDHAL